jgi:membrane protein YqaA with SNARE-associated domain
VKATITRLLLKYKVFLLAFLTPLGFWGAGIISLIDAASIPVPMELIMAGYVWNDRHHFFLYTLLAALGAAIGGLVPFYLGRAGGEIFLLRRIDRARYEQMLHRFEKQEFLAMLIPSLLPPPTPWKAFVFAAGVFEMPPLNFLLAVFLGRVIRFTIEALLVIHYGPQIAGMTSDLFKQHTRGFLIGLGIVAILVVFWAVRKAYRKKRSVVVS